MNIGNNIKQLRQQRNFTQAYIAEKIGVTYQAVSRWENNRSSPDIELLPKIACVLGVSIDTLFIEDIK